MLSWDMLVYGICVRIWNMQGDLRYRRRRLYETFSLRREASMQYKTLLTRQEISAYRAIFFTLSFSLRVLILVLLKPPAHCHEKNKGDMSKTSPWFSSFDNLSFLRLYSKKNMGYLDPEMEVTIISLYLIIQPFIPTTNVPQLFKNGTTKRKLGGVRIRGREGVGADLTS